MGMDRSSLEKVKNALAAAQVFLTTPFHREDLSVDLEGVAQNALALVKEGVRVLVATPGTGEISSLTTDERTAIATRLLREIKRDVLVIPTIGGAIQDIVKSAKQLEAKGARAFLVRPLAGSPSDAEIYEYFGGIASEVKAAVIPEVVGNPSAPLMDQISDVPNIIAVKWSGKDIGYFQGIVSRLAKANLSWICGLGEMYAPYFSLAGADGYTSGLMNLVPRLSIRLQGALARGDQEQALKLLTELTPLNELRTRREGGNSISVLKAGLDILGRVGGPVRSPHRELCSQDQVELEQVLADLVTKGFCGNQDGKSHLFGKERAG